MNFEVNYPFKFSLSNRPTCTRADGPTQDSQCWLWQLWTLAQESQWWGMKHSSMATLHCVLLEESLPEINSTHINIFCTFGLTNKRKEKICYKLASQIEVHCPIHCNGCRERFVCTHCCVPHRWDVWRCSGGFIVMSALWFLGRSGQRGLNFFFHLLW